MKTDNSLNWIPAIITFSFINIGLLKVLKFNLIYWEELQANLLLMCCVGIVELVICGISLFVLLYKKFVE